MFKAINNFFSTKHDLLAIGLFTGASIALMLSELFNWFLNNQVAKVLSVNGFWFAFVSFLVLILKLACIAFVLFDIEWLYNRFVRKPYIQKTTTNLVEQEKGVAVALEEKTGFDAKTVNVMQADTVSATSPAEAKNKTGFIAEYLQGHDVEDSKVKSQPHERNVLESFEDLEFETQQTEANMFGVKYNKRDELRHQLDSLSREDDSESSIDIVTMLKKDLEIASQQQQFSTSDGFTQSKQLSADKIRSILAKN